MRLVQFVQVLLLLALGAYLLLVALENPALVRLPLPLGQGELTVTVGAVVGVSMALGAAYTALLLLPPLWVAGQRRRRAVRERTALESQFTAALQARLVTLPAHTLPAPAVHEQNAPALDHLPERA